MAGFLFVFVFFVRYFVREGFSFVGGSRRKRHGLQVRRALHAGVPEIIARRTYNPRCLSLEVVRSLLCNFGRTTGTSEMRERSKVHRRLRVFGIGR